MNLRNNKKPLFGTWDFYKTALLIALPVMGQNLIQTLVSLVDSFMVSGLGDVKMAGVNIAGQLLFVFMVLSGTICSSGGIFLTQFFGAKNSEGMSQCVRYKVIVSGVCVVLYLLVCMVFPRPLLALLVNGNSQSAEILDQAERYLFLMGFMGIPMGISQIAASSLREIGEVKVPLVISVIATLINTFLNWVLIYGNLGAPRMEVEGAALASVIARVIEVIMYLAWLNRHRQPFSFPLRQMFQVDWKLFRDILKKGSLVIFSEMLWVISETVTTALYNSRGGADVVSGMSCSFAIANLFFVAFAGIATSTGIILGKALGAGDLDDARLKKRWLMSASWVFGLAMTLVGFVSTLLIPVVFGNLSASSQSICRSMVMMMALFMPFWVYQNGQFAVSRAGGDTLMGVVVDGSVTIFITLPLVFALAWFTPIGPVLMYLFIKLTDMIKMAVAELWLKKERWVKNLAEEHKTAEAV